MGLSLGMIEVSYTSAVGDAQGASQSSQVTKPLAYIPRGFLVIRRLVDPRHTAITFTIAAKQWLSGDPAASPYTRHHQHSPDSNGPLRAGSRVLRSQRNLVYSLEAFALAA